MKLAASRSVVANRDDWLMAVVLACVVPLVFFRAMECGFVNIDDPFCIKNVPEVTAGLTPNGFAWAFTTFRLGNWHPLTWLSLQLDSTLWPGSAKTGPDPRGYHLTNVLLHAANAALLFLALRTLTAAYWRSAVVALLFAVHPLRVESVVWISERKDVLSVFFGLLALVAYARYVRLPTRFSYLLVFLAFACSLTSKPMLVTLPFVLLLLDWWPLRRASVMGAAPAAAADAANKAPGVLLKQPNRRNSEPVGAGSRVAVLESKAALALKSAPNPSPVAGANERAFALWPGGNAWLRLALEKLPLLVLAIAISAVTIVAQQSRGATRGDDYPFVARIENAAISYVAYLSKSVWPTGLAVLYPHPLSPGGGGLSTVGVAAAAALLIVVTVVALLLRRRAPYILVGWLWFLGTLVPTIGIIQVGGQAYADRYTYFPQIGLLLVICWGAADLAGQRAKRLALAAAAVAAGVLAVQTWQIVPAWKDSIALWENARRVTENSSVVLACLGDAYGEQSDQPNLMNAAKIYRKSIAVDGNLFQSHAGLAGVLSRLGDFKHAADEYKIACDLQPLFPIVHSEYGVALYALRKLPEARAEQETAIRLMPDYPIAHRNLGQVALAQQDFELAAKEYTEALQFGVASFDVHLGLGIALYKTGEHGESLRHLKAAVELDPTSDLALFHLGQVHEARNELEEALACYDRAVQVQPRQPRNLYGKSNALRKLGREGEASRWQAMARQLDEAMGRPPR
jgi:tetratricopeptide (TPR) repeat protein